MSSLPTRSLNQKQFIGLNKQQGFSLIEALVAFLVLSIGMLGIASLQVLSLKAGKTAVMRTIAVIKVEEMMERIRNNPTMLDPAVAGSYVTASALGTNFSCNDYGTYNTCTAEQMAQDDIYQWIEGLKDILPNTGVTASIGVVDPNPGTQPAATVTVTINWQERSTETQTMVNMNYTSSAFICPSTAC